MSHLLMGHESSSANFLSITHLPPFASVCFSTIVHQFILMPFFGKGFSCKNIETKAINRTEADRAKQSIDQKKWQVYRHLT